MDPSVREATVSLLFLPTVAVSIGIFACMCVFVCVLCMLMPNCLFYRILESLPTTNVLEVLLYPFFFRNYELYYSYFISNKNQLIKFQFYAFPAV